MIIKALNLSLLVLFPVAWFAPLATAGFLPFFEGDRISVITGVQTLWEKDLSLALLVAFFAMVAPILKTALLAMVQFNMLKPRALPLIGWMSKLAMADIFLIAVYIVIVKGVGIGRVETAWGLWFFTGCVVLSIVTTQLTKVK